MKRANVSDVARNAGVSTATVSRVLNDPKRVTEATRNRVLSAIDKLQFVKSATAFSFKVRQTHHIQVLAAHVGNIYYSEVFKNLHNAAELEGYTISLASPEAGNVSRQMTNNLRSGRYDGVIMLDNFDIDAEDYAQLVELYGGTPPLVGFAEKLGELRYPHVYINNRKAAYEATMCLIENGHVEIGHICGPTGRTVTTERLSGFHDALAEAGIKPNPKHIFEGEFHRDCGRRIGRQLARMADRPSAMFCASDEIAMGLISELSILGIRTPHDMSVIGFDNVCVADVYVPALTTISQPLGQIGQSAFELLRIVMEDPSVSPQEIVVLETNLARRASVMPPKPKMTNKNR